MNADMGKVGLIEAFMMLIVFLFIFVKLFSYYEHKAPILQHKVFFQWTFF